MTDTMTTNTPTTPTVPTSPPPGYALGVAVGAFGAMLAGLGFALYSRYAGDFQAMDVALAVAFLAFLTSLVAAHRHQRRHAGVA